MFGRLFIVYAWLMWLLFSFIAIFVGYGAMLFLAFMLFIVALARGRLIMEKVDRVIDVLFAVFWATVIYDNIYGGDASFYKYLFMLILIALFAAAGYFIDYWVYTAKTKSFTDYIDEARDDTILFRSKTPYSLAYVYGYVDGEEGIAKIVNTKQASLGETDRVELDRAFLEKYTLAMDKNAEHGFFRLPAIMIDGGRHKNSMIIIVPRKMFRGTTMYLGVGEGKERAEAHLFVKDDSLKGELYAASKKAVLLLRATATTIHDLSIPKGAGKIEAKLAEEKIGKAVFSHPLSVYYTYYIIYGDKGYLSPKSLLKTLKKKLLVKTPMIIGCSDGSYEAELVLHQGSLSKIRETKTIKLEPVTNDKPEASEKPGQSAR